MIQYEHNTTRHDTTRHGFCSMSPRWNHRVTDCLHFSICACHACAGAMLMFSVSFQF